MCDSCEVVRINGVLCHETGCPKKDVGKVKECKWCGAKFTVENQENTWFCSQECGDDYYS